MRHIQPGPILCVRSAMDELGYMQHHLSEEELELALAKVSEDTPVVSLATRRSVATTELAARKLRARVALH